MTPAVSIEPTTKALMPTNEHVTTWMSNRSYLIQTAYATAIWTKPNCVGAALVNMELVLKIGIYFHRKEQLIIGWGISSKAVILQANPYSKTVHFSVISPRWNSGYLLLMRRAIWTLFSAAL